MPIAGNLTEFPLPEVLLLIGNRTGRLKIHDVRGCATVEIDLSRGQVASLRIESAVITQPAQIIAELSFLIQLGDGLFEFRSQPIGMLKIDEPLPISQLVMSLVLHVDEKLARQRAVLAPELFYLLASAAPRAALNDAENLFLQQSRRLLAGGVRAEDLAHYLGLSNETTKSHLERLHKLGCIKVQETSDVQTLRAALAGPEFFRRTDKSARGLETPEHSRRASQRLKRPSSR